MFGDAEGVFQGIEEEGQRTLMRKSEMPSGGRYAVKARDKSPGPCHVFII